MADISFSFTFLADQDRILLWFRGDEAPAPVYLTRRLTRILGGFLRTTLERIADLPDHLSETERREYMQFFHERELASNPPQWTKDLPVPSEEPVGGPNMDPGARLVTRIDTGDADGSLVLSCFEKERFLVRLTLDPNGVHRVFHSLGQMARTAGWNLGDELAWKPPETGYALSRQLN